jgi:predicted nucleotide-binding protein
MPQKARHGVPPEPEGEPELLVPRFQMDQEFEDQITAGQELLEQTTAELQTPTLRIRKGKYHVLHDQYYNWNEYNEQLLRSRFSTGKLADEYRGIIGGFGGDGDERQKLEGLAGDFDRQLRRLVSIRQRLGLFKSVEISAARDGSATPHIGDRIFIVHGHNGDTKLQVAEFVERVTGERPVILHEQADSGRTIIEKFEEHASEAGFAIILLTADDEGKAKNAANLNPRARQNVVLEFGYFMAKLGRGRVVALHEPGVELPSDISGLLYKPLTGNWKFELAGEIEAAGIDIDLAKALRR